MLMYPPGNEVYLGDMLLACSHMKCFRIGRRKTHCELHCAYEHRLRNFLKVILEIRQVVSLPKSSKLRNRIGLW